MKRRIEILGILLMLLTAGNVSLFAQRGVRVMRQDSTRKDRIMMERMPLLMHNPDSMQMRRMRPGRGPVWMIPGGGGWWQMPMYPMRKGFIPGPMQGIRRGMGPLWMDRTGRFGMHMDSSLLEKIPNLTEKQKKDITDLRQKHQDEMKKLREEMSAKMKSLRESNREKIMNLLTDEQKKWFESNAPAVKK